MAKYITVMLDMLLSQCCCYSNNGICGMCQAGFLSTAMDLIPKHENRSNSYELYTLCACA